MGTLQTNNIQGRVHRWMLRCFGREIAGDKRERADRFVEEALELAQTIPGFTAERAHTLVDYVFNRDVGKARQEVGGTLVTLMALCNALEINAGGAVNEEMARIEKPDVIETIRVKQASKRDIHGPLPV